MLKPGNGVRISHLPRVYRLIWAAAGKLTLLWAILLIVQGLVPVAFVYLTKPLVDAMQAAIGHGLSWESATPVVTVAVAMGGALLLRELAKVGIEWVAAAQAELVQDHLSDLLHAKSTSVDLAFYETPDYHDRMYRARTDATNRPLALLESSGNLVQNGITVVGMAAVLFRYGAWLPPVLLAGTLPAFYVVVRASRRYHEWWTATTGERRRTQYFDVVLTDAHYAGEIRFFGLAAYFRNAYRQARKHLRTGRLGLLTEQSVARVGAETIALLVSASAIAWVVVRALRGLATLGDIALFYQALQTGQGLMRALLGNLSQMYGNGLFLANLFEFLDLDARIVTPPNPVATPAKLRQGIRFRDVTFRYPGTDRVALENFNLTIPAGRTVAIVGANGAGKSTLIKLLCRFYDPESGKVELDGIDLRMLSVDDLRRMITIMFQQPVSYQDTARQNIGLGNIAGANDPAAIETAARGAGAHQVISGLPKGYDSVLGKWFSEGSDLSAGEWQRVAMARAYLRKSEIIVLDEPTSMLDSWAEAEWFEKFRDLARDQTAVIVTHRLTIAMRADVIHVMQRGRIVESGSHQELLALGGLYCKSWKAQLDSTAESEPGDDDLLASVSVAGRSEW